MGKVRGKHSMGRINVTDANHDKGGVAYLFIKDLTQKLENPALRIRNTRTGLFLQRDKAEWRTNPDDLSPFRQELENGGLLLFLGPAITDQIDRHAAIEIEIVEAKIKETILWPDIRPYVRSKHLAADEDPVGLDEFEPIIKSASAHGGEDTRQKHGETEDDTSQEQEEAEPDGPVNGAGESKPDEAKKPDNHDPDQASKPEENHPPQQSVKPKPSIIPVAVSVFAALSAGGILGWFAHQNFTPPPLPNPDLEMRLEALQTQSNNLKQQAKLLRQENTKLKETRDFLSVAAYGRLPKVVFDLPGKSPLGISVASVKASNPVEAARLFALKANQSSDDKEKTYWLAQAAKLGHAQAMLALADRYFKGKGVPENKMLSVQLARYASLLGAAKADDYLKAILSNAYVPAATSKAKNTYND